MSSPTSKNEDYENGDFKEPPKLNQSVKLPTQREIGLTRYNWESNEIQSQLPTDVLLITANEHEFKACYSYMQDIKRSNCKELGMVDFGKFGDNNNQNVKVALIRCRQGPTEAVITVKNAAEILFPKVVLFVGICATMKPEKAKLGDVVISAKLATYADVKIREDGTVEYRGIKAPLSRYMSSLILSAADGWGPPLENQDSLNVEVHCDAVMLSGPELVNNLKRRQQLLSHFKDALGLEMEGAGLYAAAGDLGIEWAVVKAVSDFGDGTKTATEKWQRFSSVMAASIVHNIFKYPDVIQDWNHYKNAQPLIKDSTAVEKTGFISQ